MPTTQQREQHDKMEQHMREALNALIGEQVIHTLGKPNGLHSVQVRQLWEDHYRVNILVGEDAVSTKIAQSFFLTADGDGNIIASAPKITKQY
jgi:hypothetical protein